jgi:hypothetical protein
MTERKSIFRELAEALMAQQEQEEESQQQENPQEMDR